MLITNVDSIYELKLGVFARPIESFKSYEWKGLISYDYNGYNPYLTTKTDILISGIPSQYGLGNPTRILVAWVSTHPCRSIFG